MATVSANPELHPSRGAGAPLLVSLPSLSPESFEEVVRGLGKAFSGMEVVVASPDAESQEGSFGNLEILPYKPSTTSSTTWTLTAADYLNAHELVRTRSPAAVLILSAESESLAPDRLRALAEEVLGGRADLVVPRYRLPARSGLVNSAVLYPISRALFGAGARFPLPLDLCLSLRMCERLAMAGQRFTSLNQPEALLWPVAEAAVAGFTTVEVEVGGRTLPQPPDLDLDSLLSRVAGSLFAEVDARASFWQRSRVAQPGVRVAAEAHAPKVSAEEVQAMIDSFRLAYSNLSEIWSLVLPPQSLFGLKRLSAMGREQLRMTDTLWARIVYDFVLAFRLRTINRGHLLGALTPIYLAWVASHLMRTDAGEDAESQIEALALAFEKEKPYLVSRWRWPDRFNP